MIVGSIKEDLASEKRVSLTPETAKNIMGLGLKVCVEKNYATHLGIEDNEYKKTGVEIKDSSSEVLNSSNLIIKVNCPSENEISLFKEKSILDEGWINGGFFVMEPKIFKFLKIQRSRYFFPLI